MYMNVEFVYKIVYIHIYRHVYVYAIINTNIESCNSYNDSLISDLHLLLSLMYKNERLEKD